MRVSLRTRIVLLCLIGWSLQGCQALRRSQAERADAQLYTRREWQAHNGTNTTPPTATGGEETAGNTGTSGTSNPVPEATGGTAATSAKVGARARKVVATAKSFLGTPYVYGGNSRKGLDCSALIQQAYASVGITMPRTSRDQGKQGKPIRRNQAQPGDLLFFYASTAGVVGHVGIVVETKDGDLQFIHAALNGGVRTDWLSNRHWSAHYLYARRVL